MAQTLNSQQLSLAARPELPELSERGLSSSEALRRLSQVGPNETGKRRRASIFVEILLLFVNPLVIILIIASGVSAALGEVINAAIIITMVLLSVAINFIQTFHSQ